jgi:hypothetical protein
MTIASKTPSRLGGEFRGTKYITDLRQHGIIVKETIPYHTEINPVDERVNRTIMAIAMSVTISIKLAKNMWSEQLNRQHIQKIESFTRQLETLLLSIFYCVK